MRLFSSSRESDRLLPRPERLARSSADAREARLRLLRPALRVALQAADSMSARNTVRRRTEQRLENLGAMILRVGPWSWGIATYCVSVFISKGDRWRFKASPERISKRLRR